MSMLEQTDDQDIKITNNSFTLVESDNEIRQRLINRLKSFFREWFLDQTLGIPWFQLIFVKETPPSVIDTVLKDAILSTPGIIGFRSYTPLDLDVSSRQLQITFEVKTINSTTININEVIP